MAETIGRMSMIKKTCYQLYHLACSFEQVLWNVTTSDVGNIHA